MEEEVPKKHYSKITILTVISVVVVVIIASLIYIWQTTENPPLEVINDAVFNNQEENSINNDQNPEITDNDYYDLPDEGSGGGSGGGSSSSGGSSCPTQQISYSIKNIQKNIECLEYQGETCVHQSLDCSAEIYNLDNEISGTFKIEIRFVDRSQDSLIIGSQSKEFSLGPGDFEIVQGATSLQGQNPELDCFFNTIEVPKREIC